MNEKLNYLQMLMIRLSTEQSNETINEIDEQLRIWESSDQVIVDSLSLLAFSNNQIVYFFSLCAILSSIRTHKQDFPKQYVNDIINFILPHFIAQNVGNSQMPFFKFSLVCCADICIFFNSEYPINWICENLPEDIISSFVLCYLEEAKQYNKGSNLFPEVSKEYIANILKNLPVSDSWLTIYSYLSEIIPSNNRLIEFIPNLTRLINIPDSYDMLIDHIECVMVISFSEYSAKLLQFSCSFSDFLRSYIENLLQNNQEISEQYIPLKYLIKLWSSIFSIDDEDETLFSSSYLKFTNELISKFIEAGITILKVMNNDEEILRDIKKLLLNLIRFCLYITDDSLKWFILEATNFIMEFFKFEINEIKIDSNRISENFQDLYFKNQELFDHFFLNQLENDPRPGILSIISMINNFPLEIASMYSQRLSKFEEFHVDLLNFSLRYSNIFDNYSSYFLHIFSKYFPYYPKKCSVGLFKLLTPDTKFSFDTTAIFEFLTESLTKFSMISSKSPLIYIIPTIINNSLSFNENVLKEIVQHILQLIVEFMKRVNCEDDFDHFFNNIEKIIENLNTNIPIVKRVGILMYIHISQNLGDIWNSKSEFIQSILVDFVIKSDLEGISIKKQAIAEWLNRIIVKSPYRCHFELLGYLVDYLDMMENVCNAMRSNDNEFVEVALYSFYSTNVWSSKIYIFFPPNYLLELLNSGKFPLVSYLIELGLNKDHFLDQYIYQIMCTLANIFMRNQNFNYYEKSLLLLISSKIGEEHFKSILSSHLTDEFILNHIINALFQN